MSRSHYEDEYFEGNEDHFDEDDMYDTMNTANDSWEDKYDDSPVGEMDLNWDEPDNLDIFDDQDDAFNDAFNGDYDDQDEDNWTM